MIEGATAQVRGLSYGNLPKRDATHFIRAVINYAVLSYYVFDVSVLSWCKHFTKLIIENKSNVTSFLGEMISEVY